jgi:hypothetical protein
MKTMHRILFISLVIIATLLASGCQSNEATANQGDASTATLPSVQVAKSTETMVKASATATKQQPTLKPTLKATQESTDATTAALELTAQASITPATLTPTAIKIADFSSAKFFTGGALPNWQYFIALEFDGHLTGEYYAVVDRNKDYSCEILPMYPHRLYCDGPQAAFMDFVRFEVFDAKTDKKVYEERIWIPGTYYKD